MDQLNQIGDQNRAEDRYEEEAYNPNEEGQHVYMHFNISISILALVLVLVLVLTS